jgi:hypothetical protein
MTALLSIAWFLALLLSVCAVFQFVGMRLMVSYFPEGRRWWMLPAQLGSLALFAALIHYNPF